MDKLSINEAEEYVEKAKKKAVEIGVPMAIAVVDDTGHLVVVKRMDGAPLLTPDIARGKAYTAILFRRPSREVEERFKDRPAFLNSIVAIEPGRMVPGKGAVLIRRGGEIVGAIGLSGGTAEQDDICAEAAVV
ncbi:MAG: heme-binding protein [Candidatus Bathyarchaeia archaeon]